jgi:hypothetical protein
MDRMHLSLVKIMMAGPEGLEALLVARSLAH